MDGFFYRFIKSKNPESKAYKREIAKKVCGNYIKYISKAEGSYGESIVGRDGRCTLKNGIFTVYSSNAAVFSCGLDDLKIFILMSLDGATVSGPNAEANGEYEEMTVHYK